jgi:hypothetical protein
MTLGERVAGMEQMEHMEQMGQLGSLGSREESNACSRSHHLKQRLIALALDMKIGPTRRHFLVSLVRVEATRILQKRSLWEAQSVV